MLTFIPSCDIFSVDADIYVNTVNCVGIMGKGVALAVKTRYPSIMIPYQRACREKVLRPGRLFGFNASDGKIIIGIATKDHWRDPSRYQWIEHGLSNLAGCLMGYPGCRVVIPPLGCGNGQLDWNVVKPMINNALAEMPGNEIIVIEPPVIHA